MSSKTVSEYKLLSKHTLIYGSGIVINSLVSFLLLPIYTRYLTPHDYGLQELVGLCTGILGILLGTAITSSIFRFYFEYDDIRERNEVISSSIILIALSGPLVLCLLYFVSKPLALYVLDSKQLYCYFNISFAAMFFQMLNNIGYDYLRANYRSLNFILLSLISMVVLISLNIYFIVFLGIGVMGIFLSTLINAVIVTFILIIPLMIRIGPKFSLEKIKKMLRFGVPLIGSQLGGFAVHVSDRFFLKAYSSIAATGIYSLGYKFGTIPSMFISTPFNQVWLPRRMELYKQQGSEELFGKIFTYFLLAISFVGLCIAVLTREVLMVMSDPKFWNAYKIVPIIVLANTIFTFHYHFNIGLLIKNKTKEIAGINISNALVVIILNFILIPSFGVYGAAYATLLAFIYKIALTYYLSSRYYKIHFEAVRILKIIISAIVIFICCTNIYVTNQYLSIAIKMIGLCTFPCILYLMGFFSFEEKAAIRSYAQAIFYGKGLA